MRQKLKQVSLSCVHPIFLLYIKSFQLTMQTMLYIAVCSKLCAVLMADRRARAESVWGAEAEDQLGQSCLLQ